MVIENLKKRVLTSFGILGFSQVFQQLFALINKIILARLLIPDDFGLASMAFIILSVIGMFGTFSVGSAFIHKKKDKDFEISKDVLFIFSAVMSIIYFVLTFLSAPYVAGFFKVPALKLMVIVLSFGFLIRIIAAVPGTMLQKELMFGRKTAVIITGTLVAFIITVSLAFLGYGAWSIVWGSIGMAISQAILQFIFVPYIPRFRFSKGIFKEFFNYSKYLVIGKFVGVVIQQGDDTMIGRLLGAASLGFYSLAVHAATLPMILITGVVNQVMFPLFSKLQEDIETFKNAFVRGFKLSTFFAVPAVGGILALAPEIVFVVFGEKWMPIVPFIYVLGGYGLIRSIASMNGSVLNAFGHTKVIQNISIVKLIVFVLLVYPMIKLWGVAGICAMLVMYAIIEAFIGFSKISHYFPGMLKRTIPILAKVFVNVIIMIVGVYFIKKYIFVSFTIPNLIFNIIAGMVIYFGASFLIDRNLKNDIKEAIDSVL